MLYNLKHLKVLPVFAQVNSAYALLHKSYNDTTRKALLLIYVLFQSSFEPFKFVKMQGNNLVNAHEHSYVSGRYPRWDCVILQMSHNSLRRFGTISVSVVSYSDIHGTQARDMYLSDKIQTQRLPESQCEILGHAKKTKF